MKNLRSIVATACLIALIAFAVPASALADDSGTQGGSNSTSTAPPPPPPPTSGGTLAKLALLILLGH
jgi:hypothetical protein